MNVFGRSSCIRWFQEKVCLFERRCKVKEYCLVGKTKRVFSRMLAKNKNKIKTKKKSKRVVMITF